MKIYFDNIWKHEFIKWSQQNYGAKSYFELALNKRKVMGFLLLFHIFLKTYLTQASMKTFLNYKLTTRYRWKVNSDRWNSSMWMHFILLNVYSK
jgi:hypothetical protein